MTDKQRNRCSGYLILMALINSGKMLFQKDFTLPYQTVKI